MAALFVSVTAMGQDNAKVLVKLNAMADGAKLTTLTYGKLSPVFSKADNACVVIPNSNDAATLANLEKELRALLPSATIIIRKED